jgi:hypothetical protein
MKLIDVDSKTTLEDFLTLKKRLNLYSFYGNVMNKSVVTRMSCGDDCILVLAFSFSRFDVFALASQYLMVLVLIFLTEVL